MWFTVKGTIIMKVWFEIRPIDLKITRLGTDLHYKKLQNTIKRNFC